MGYTGWELPGDERAKLLELFPQRYERLVAHHVTLDFGVPPGHPLPDATEGEVIGTVDDESGVQALIVAIDGNTERPDGSTTHITWSLADGRQPVESNLAIQEFGWRPAEPVAIRLVPRFFA
ncbi:hypothetical protein [Azospirillum doebereinerae]|uniref:Uncharacterized protein n=1 Tax=Azospirillum doebereinerae TaxID=92933 RepID=A0A433J2T5_9PROT|nr:hypothetical protein [Azospirillum doebereinerae]RUQ65995.1 hypothetical protein EJ913_24445 [Azospirillum doebereinerae]